MLSYVVPTKDTQIIIPNNNSSAMTPHRNLSLNLSPQFPHKNNASDIAAYEPHELNNVHIANVADCDERTSLLTRISTPPPTQTTRQNTNNFNHNNNNNNNNAINDSVDNFDETDACLENSNTMDSDLSYSQATNASTTKKTKLSKLGTKSVGLKRVSFGSSKGSMVETLVFETPTPLSEKVEPTFAFESSNRQQKSQNSQNAVLIGGRGNLDDSGIEAQEESERSIVRVSIYQSSKPQQICPPEFLTRFDDSLEESFNSYNCNFEDSMTTAATPGYDRQQSTDSGWDNPFRPGGDLSREADEIVNMIRGGKPITPTEDHVIGNGNAQIIEEHCNGNAITETVNKTNVTQTQSAQNGTNATNHTPAIGGKVADNNGVTSSSTTQVSKQVVPGPTSASHVVIDEKKNKKKGCCVVQ